MKTQPQWQFTFLFAWFLSGFGAILSTRKSINITSIVLYWEDATKKWQRTKNRKKISHEFPSVYIRLLCESIICLLASMKIKSTSENKNANKIHTFPDFLELASAFVQISQSIQLERPLVSPASFLRSIHCCCPFPSKFVRRWICIFIFEYEFCFYFPKLNSMQRNGEREIEKKC